MVQYNKIPIYLSYLLMLQLQQSHGIESNRNQAKIFIPNVYLPLYVLVFSIQYPSWYNNTGTNSNDILLAKITCIELWFGMMKWSYTYPHFNMSPFQQSHDTESDRNQPNSLFMYILIYILSSLSIANWQYNNYETNSNEFSPKINTHSCHTVPSPIRLFIWDSGSIQYSYLRKKGNKYLQIFRGSFIKNSFDYDECSYWTTYKKYKYYSRVATESFQSFLA